MDFPADLWRDLVVALAALAGIYIAVLLVRLLRVQRSAARAQAEPPARHEPPPLTPAEAALARSFGVRAPLPEPPELRGPQEPTVAPAVPDAPTATAAAPGGFVDELARRELEREVQRLRREAEALREALANVREEIERLKAARNVSPLYSEAASLAERGISADGIAGRCGISLGEAELVAALARARTPTRDDAFNLQGDIHDGRTGPERTGTHD